MTDTNTAAMVADLKATDDAVRAKGWVAPGLGVPGAPLGLLGSTRNPLTGLAAAGLSWFTPLVSFLGEPLTRLQGGNGASVTSGSQDFGAAGQDIAGVAEVYRQSAATQTSGWTGAAATEYRTAAAEHADGVEGLGQASNTVGSAIIGAGQVVAQAIAEVTELIAEAVAQIVPIMTQAVARAGETFGQSVVEAIPPCVGIAVQYALRIAAKLAALVASGNNLLKLVQGGMAVVDLIQQALSGISRQSVSATAGAGPGTGSGTGAGQHGGLASTLAAADPGSTAGADNRITGSPGPTAPAGGFGGGEPIPGGMVPGGSAIPRDIATQTAGAVPPSPAPVPDATRHAGGAGGSGVATGAVPGGGVQAGAATPGLAPGARVGGGRGADTGHQEGRQQPARTTGSGGGTPGAVPLGATGGRANGEADKEHQRKYPVAEGHDEVFVTAPPVITSR